MPPAACAGADRPFSHPPVELTAAQFGSLAAGYGDAGALRVLVTGQASRRRLLLLAVVQAAREAQLCAAAGVDEAMAIVTAADRAAPAEASRVLDHPLVAAWAIRCLRRLRDAGAGQDRDRAIAGLGYLAGLGAAAGAAAGIDFELSMPSGGNALFLPTLGTMTPVGRDPVTVRGEAGAITIHRAGGHRPVPATREDRTDGWLPVRTVSAERNGQRLELAIEDGDPYRDGYRSCPAGRLSDTDVAKFEDLLAQAWSWLVRRLPAHALAIGTILRSVIPLRPEPDPRRHVSATSRSAFGSVAMSMPPDPHTLALSLVHEVQHAKLGALLDIVDLYRERGDRFRAPWRTDPRPVGALLQGAYAHLGVASYWRARDGGTAPVRAQVTGAYWHRQLGEVLETLSNSRALAPAGERFVAGMATTLQAWDREPLAPGVNEVVSAATTISAVSWRLQNFRPAPDEVAELVLAWQRAARCPPLPAARLAGTAQPGPADNGLEVAGLLLERAATVRDWAEQVRRWPDDDLAWCALAAALHGCGEQQHAAAALTARPDLVREMHRSIGPQSPTLSPATLAAWLSGAHGGVGSM